MVELKAVQYFYNLGLTYALKGTDFLLRLGASRLRFIAYRKNILALLNKHYC